ncbi:hypothetical protein O9993_10380 [Vibrio lentus]|nr:hypothetical protein [Vibrio lentus]
MTSSTLRCEIIGVNFHFEQKKMQRCSLSLVTIKLLEPFQEAIIHAIGEPQKRFKGAELNIMMALLRWLATGSIYTSWSISRLQALLFIKAQRQ